MKQGSSQQRRGRSRGSGGRRNSSNRNHNLESNGPEGKVRGTAQQVLDKYLSLARDASSSGEHIAAEGFYQYAEHYQRLLNAETANNPNPNPNHNQNRNHAQRGDNKSQGGNNDGGSTETPVNAEETSGSTTSEVVESAVTEAQTDSSAENQQPEDGSDESELAASA